MATTANEMQTLNAQAAQSGQAPAIKDTTGLSASAAPTGMQARLIEMFPSMKDILLEPAVKKATPAVMMLIIFLVFFVIYTALQEPVYRPLFPGMTDTDRQSAMESLKEGGFTGMINRSSGQLEVPAEQFHEARIYLASKGIPAEGGALGFDALKESANITTSQFMEQANYAAAVEQELAKSIVQIASIQHARVHLAIPQQSVFVRDRTPPKASVVLRRYPGRHIDDSHVRAIINLIASSVPYLLPEDVSVVDNLGNLLSDSARDSALGMTAAQLQHKQQIEDTYRNRIYQLLGPIYGEDNVRGQVDVVLDFTETESTFETYDPSSKGSVTRSEVLSLDRTARADAEGVPGSTTNQPPEDTEFSLDGSATTKGGANIGETISSRTTRNYEMDRTIRTVRDASGAVKRVSVAVAVNRFAPGEYPVASEGMDPADFEGPDTPEISEAELTRLNDLIRGVVNYDETRGDVVAVVATPFSVAANKEPVMPWYENVLLLNTIEGGLAILAFLILIFVVVRPIAYKLLSIPLPYERKAVAAAQVEAQAQQLAIAAAQSASGEDAPSGDEIEINEGETLEEIRAKLKPKKSSISMDMLDTANSYDDKVALIRMLVQEDSGRVANVLKNMIKAS